MNIHDELTVSEFIALLKTLDQNAKVTVRDDRGGTFNLTTADITECKDEGCIFLT